MTDFLTYVQRLATMDPFEVRSVDVDGNVAPGFVVSMHDVVNDLTIWNQNLQEQVSLVGTQIGWWARVSARCKRVWACAERAETIWKAQQRLKLYGSDVDGKKVTQAMAEDLYRVDPTYVTLNNEVERAEEAYNSACEILAAFKAKKDMLREDVRRAPDGSLHRMTV